MTASSSAQIAGIALDRPADLSSRKVQESLSPSALLGFFRLDRSVEACATKMPAACWAGSPMEPITA